MAEVSRNSFVFYASFYEALENLPAENQLELYTAICKYSLYDETPEMSGISKAMFTLMKPNIDAATKRYDANAENGKKGGRPKKSQPETQLKPNKNPTETQLKPNLNLNKDKDSDKDENEDSDKEWDKEYQLIAGLYSSLCPSLPPIKSLTPSRVEIIQESLNTFSVDDFRECFILAESSGFLTGNNERQWKASFDWLIDANNMAKVLEGNYINKATLFHASDSTRTSTRSTGGNIFAELLEDEMRANQ